MKKQNTIFLLFLLLFFSFFLQLSWAEEGWLKNGKFVADKPHAKAKEGFGAKLLIVDDPKLFVNWNKPTKGVMINPTNIAIRNKPVFVVVIFVNPGVVNKLTSVTQDIVVEAPDGSIYAKKINMPVWVDLPAPPNGNLQLSSEYMGIVIEDKDLSGRYLVISKVYDNIRKITLSLKQYFDVE